MRTSKQLLHAPQPRYSASGSEATLPSWPAVLRTATLVAVFVFLGACVFGAI